MVLDQARTGTWAQQRPVLGSTTWKALPATPLPVQEPGALAASYSQTHAGVRRKHVDVIFTQRVDNDGLAPVHQVSCKLENLQAEGAGKTMPGKLTFWGFFPDYPTFPRMLGTASRHSIFCAQSNKPFYPWSLCSFGLSFSIRTLYCPGWH